MKQYVVIGRDGNDEAAPERRQNIRPTHLAGASKLKKEGNYVVGGAILDDAGNMRGSVMIVQFETDEDFKKWYEQEPYVKDKVWETIEVNPFRVANV